MRATIVFDDSINKKSISKLISKIELLIASEVDGVDLYFSSTGGEADYGNVLINYINHNKSKIVLKIFGRIFSCGVYISKYTKCKKEILPEIMMMVHTANIINGDLKDLNKPYITSTWAVGESNKKTNLEFYNDIKQHLTKEEKDLFLKNEDVYIIDQNRIKNIIAGTSGDAKVS